jgi:hypothetical protein
MNYQQKYLKYKNKYLQLKNQYGGIFLENESTGQINDISYYDTSILIYLLSRSTSILHSTIDFKNILLKDIDIGKLLSTTYIDEKSHNDYKLLPIITKIKNNDINDYIINCYMNKQINDRYYLKVLIHLIYPGIYNLLNDDLINTGFAYKLEFIKTTDNTIKNLFFCTKIKEISEHKEYQGIPYIDNTHEILNFVYDSETGINDTLIMLDGEKFVDNKNFIKKIIGNPDSEIYIFNGTAYDIYKFTKNISIFTKYPNIKIEKHPTTIDIYFNRENLVTTYLDLEIYHNIEHYLRCIDKQLLELLDIQYISKYIIKYIDKVNLIKELQILKIILTDKKYNNTFYLLQKLEEEKELYKNIEEKILPKKFEEPICVDKVYIQHQGECWHDSLSMIYIFSDITKGYIQPKLYNTDINLSDTNDDDIESKLLSFKDKIDNLTIFDLPIYFMPNKINPTPDDDAKIKKILIDYKKNIYKYIKDISIRFISKYNQNKLLMSNAPIDEEEKQTQTELQKQISFETSIESAVCIASLNNSFISDELKKMMYAGRIISKDHHEGMYVEIYLINMILNNLFFIDNKLYINPIFIPTTKFQLLFNDKIKDSAFAYELEIVRYDKKTEIGHSICLFTCENIECLYDNEVGIFKFIDILNDDIKSEILKKYGHITFSNFFKYYNEICITHKIIYDDDHKIKIVENNLYKDKYYVKNLVVFTTDNDNVSEKYKYYNIEQILNFVSNFNDDDNTKLLINQIFYYFVNKIPDTIEKLTNELELIKNIKLDTALFYYINSINYKSDNSSIEKLLIDQFIIIIKAIIRQNKLLQASEQTNG